MLRDGGWTERLAGKEGLVLCTVVGTELTSRSLCKKTAKRARLPIIYYNLCVFVAVLAAFSSLSITALVMIYFLPRAKSLVKSIFM